MNRKIVTALKYTLAFLFITALTVIYFEVRDSSKLGHFRRSDQMFSTVSQNAPSRKGLAELHVSGSDRITQSSLQKALTDTAQPVYVFDLQEEPHCFIQGLPTHWYGYKFNTLCAGLPQTGKRIKIKHALRRLLQTGKLMHTPQDTQTEKEIIEQLGYHYCGTNQTRHRIPQNEQVDQFIETLNAIPAGSWIHFHCSAGRGRTTVAMVMYDILLNGKEVPLKDIIERHHLLGSENLFDTAVWANGTYTKEMLENRKNFIIKFYQYVNDPQGLGIASWKEWAKTHNANTNAMY